MAKTFLEVKKEMYQALGDKAMRTGISRGMDSYVKNYDKVKDRADVVQLRTEVKSVKDYDVKRMEELYKQAMEALQANGVLAYYANTKQDALDIIYKLVGTGKVVVKSKSMVTEEIGIRHYLQERGNEVWETDLGELIIQFRGEKPAHMISPALHVPREAVAEIFKEKFGKTFDPNDLPTMVAAAREFLRTKLLAAQVGITGINAISAADGTVVTVENEANIRLTSSLPPVNIVVGGIEKVVPTTLDAVKTALLQGYYGGSPVPTYVNLSAGPSGTRDIEKTLVRPAQGSKEMHVVLVNNGRLEALKTPLWDALRCIRCGACQLVCPTFAVDGPTWGGSTYTAAVGLLWTAITEGRDAAEPLTYFCLECDACNEICPVQINISGNIRWIKKESTEALLKK
ncbi:MAG: lactate utilization protein B [Conexivisphaerales archaeon]|jgi:L-lactate dehydrogenase complex protein LldG